MSTHSGEVRMPFDGGDIRLIYDWDAVDRLQAEMSPDEQALAIKGQVRDLARLVHIGAARHHPELTIADIRRVSPPILPTVAIVEKALTYSFYGPDGAPAEVANAGKAAPRKRMATLLSRTFGRLFGWAYRRPNSGS